MPPTDATVPQTIIDDLTSIQVDVQGLVQKQQAIPPLQADVTQKQSDLATSQLALQTAQNDVTNETNDIATAITKLQADIAALNGTTPPPPPPPPDNGGSNPPQSSARHQVTRGSR